MGGLYKSVLSGVFLLIVLNSSLATAQAEETAVYTITIDYVVQNVGPNTALDSQALIVLFDNFSGWASQEVISEQITVDGTPVLPQIFSTDDNRWTIISLGNLGPGESKTISVVHVLKVSSVDLSVNPNSVGTTFPPELDLYTVPVDGLYESDNPAIQSLAQQLTDGITNPYYKAKRVFDYLMENLDYQLQQTEHGALWGLQMGKGDCTEFSNLFIALVRAVGIPAKSISGFGYLALYTPETGKDIKELGHAWSIFYLPGYGWAPADAVWPQHIGSFGKMDYAHIVGAVTDGRDAVNEQGEIVWRSPKYIERKWKYYKGEPTQLDGSVSGSIVPEVLLDVGLQVSPLIENDMLRLTATIKNIGQSSVSNLTAVLEVDPSYFEVVSSPQHRNNLASGEDWQTSFDVQLKENAYDNKHIFTSRVTYDSSYGITGGTFLAVGETLVSIPPKPAMPQQVHDLMLLALVATLFGAIVALGVVLARR
ncbi:MAG TPA: transglutaminase domain-containing protein [Hadesarchaea archaeon]|nr:transglutaminase domain-containing protein [Hadesarchaea archaeon]